MSVSNLMAIPYTGQVTRTEFPGSVLKEVVPSLPCHGYCTWKHSNYAGHLYALMWKRFPSITLESKLKLFIKRRLSFQRPWLVSKIIGQNQLMNIINFAPYKYNKHDKLKIYLFKLQFQWLWRAKIIFWKRCIKNHIYSRQNVILNVFAT